MPVQQQMSSFAKNLGGKVAQANAEHKDKPIDTGNRRLPGGISGGVAKFSTCYTKQYEPSKERPWQNGQVFFRYSGVTMSPESHKGQKVAGIVTSVTIPMCDVPPNKEGKGGSTWSENFYQFQNFFKFMGVAPCPETPATDPTGQRTEAYFLGAAKMLNEKGAKTPIYVEFSTREWKGAKRANETDQQYADREPMVFETWHGLVQYNGQHNPAAGVQDSGPPTQAAPVHSAAPPAQPPQTPLSPQHQPPQEPEDPADVVAALVEVAMGDPQGATEDGAEATRRLEDMALAAGWSKDQTANATDWAQVGDMALNPPTAPATAPTPVVQTIPISPVVVVGSKWLFAKRTKDGERLKNNKGEPFAPSEVVVATVDEAGKTCTVKSVKDGKDVVDIRSKQPVAVKFEWLEPIK